MNSFHRHTQIVVYPYKHCTIDANSHCKMKSAYFLGIMYNYNIVKQYELCCQEHLECVLSKLTTRNFYLDLIVTDLNINIIAKLLSYGWDDVSIDISGSSTKNILDILSRGVHFKNLTFEQIVTNELMQLLFILLNNKMIDGYVEIKNIDIKDSENTFEWMKKIGFNDMEIDNNAVKCDIRLNNHEITIIPHYFGQAYNKKYEYNDLLL